MKTLLFFLLVIAILATSAVLLWLLSRRWRRLWRIIARIGASILGLFSALLAVLLLFASAMCGHYDFPLVSSPDGDLNARVSEKDCGATDSFHSSVQVWQGGWAGFLSPATTVFTVGHDPRLIQLEWTGARALAIKYPNDSPIPKSSDVKSVWVMYGSTALLTSPSMTNRLVQCRL